MPKTDAKPRRQGRCWMRGLDAPAQLSSWKSWNCCNLRIMQRILLKTTSDDSGEPEFTPPFDAIDQPEPTGGVIKADDDGPTTIEIRLQALRKQDPDVADVNRLVKTQTSGEPRNCGYEKREEPTTYQIQDAAGRSRVHMKSSARIRLLSLPVSPTFSFGVSGNWSTFIF